MTAHLAAISPHLSHRGEANKRPRPGYLQWHIYGMRQWHYAASKAQWHYAASMHKLRLHYYGGTASRYVTKIILQYVMQ